MTDYLTYGISLSFISWIFGLIFTWVLIKLNYLDKWSHLNFIENSNVNKWMGVLLVKWIIQHSFFKLFNQKLHAKPSDLATLRFEMTKAEIGHLAGFIFVMCFVIEPLVNQQYIQATLISIPNILLNLYPSLLQQFNKRRIDKITGVQTSIPY